MRLELLFGKPEESVGTTKTNASDFETFFELTILRYDKTDGELILVNFCVWNFDLGLVIYFND